MSETNEQSNPQIEAINQMALEQYGREVMLRTRLIAAERKVAELADEIARMKAVTPTPKAASRK